MTELCVRRGVENDLHALQQLLFSHQMETDVDPSEFWLADVEDHLVGVARLEWEGGLAYLRPIAVDHQWQAQGIGRALVERIVIGLPQINVVARGGAVGFYTRLGFVPAPWEQVPERYRQECEDCPGYPACEPRPMVWKRS